MFGLQTVDEIDDIEEAAARSVADQGAGKGNRPMRLAGSGASDEHGVALVGDEGAIGKIADQHLVDRRAVEVELLDVLCDWQLGNGKLVFDGSRLLLGTNDPGRLMLALDTGCHDLVIGAAHVTLPPASNPV